MSGPHFPICVLPHLLVCCLCCYLHFSLLILTPPLPLFLHIHSYAFGILLWEISTADYPFKDVSPALLPHQVVKKHLRPSFHAEAPEEFVALTRACWDPDALRR